MSLWQRLTVRRTDGAQNIRYRFSPRLEALEDRCLLSYTVTDLGTLGGTNSGALGINASGQVIGDSYLPGDVVFHAFLYDATATPPMQDLGTLGGSSSYAYGINASSQVVGEANPPSNGSDHAFLYDATAAPPMQDLGTLGGSTSSARGINDSGQVVGWAYIRGEAAYHAFLYDATAGPVLQDLGTLGGSNSGAYSINASGQVAGSANIAGDTAAHAFLYDATATPAMQDLGTLGGSNSEAWGINAAGQVVGDAYTAGNVDHAFLYDATATPALQDLNDQIPAGSGWVLQGAQAINDSGQIVGYGTHNGPSHAFLLTPVPAPTSGQPLEVATHASVTDVVSSLETGGKVPPAVPTAPEPRSAVPALVLPRPVEGLALTLLASVPTAADQYQQFSVEQQSTHAGDGRALTPAALDTAFASLLSDGSRPSGEQPPARPGPFRRHFDRLPTPEQLIADGKRDAVDFRLEQ